MRTLVYGWRRHEKYLYIGQTKALLRRLSTHHKVGKILDFEESDQLDIWFVDAGNVLVVEEALIRLYQPLYNGDWESRVSEAIKKERAERRAKLTAISRARSRKIEERRRIARNRYIKRQERPNQIIQKKLSLARMLHKKGQETSFNNVIRDVKIKFPKFDMSTWLKELFHRPEKED
jgi:hypothetical protein